MRYRQALLHAYPIHFNVTRNPTDFWVAQQLREATPFGARPRFLIRDNDGKFGSCFDTVAEMTGIEIVKIPPSSPNLDPICERFLGSVRRECLDHLLVHGERQLRRVLREHVESYFNSAQPHQRLSQRTPVAPVARSFLQDRGKVVALPLLGGLHHDYRLAA